MPPCLTTPSVSSPPANPVEPLPAADGILCECLPLANRGTLPTYRTTKQHYGPLAGELPKLCPLQERFIAITMCLSEIHTAPSDPCSHVVSVTSQPPGRSTRHSTMTNVPSCTRVDGSDWRPLHPFSHSRDPIRHPMLLNGHRHGIVILASHLACLAWVSTHMPMPMPIATWKTLKKKIISGTLS
ncbi:hypothetical protein BS50DRAFT_414280 [Corynespora cassiicola Philippines]|uniref:Uncharacterized protein n=1 Tax=Corynespora cassiicola Philippines TaxID=1448308 RepID=A0A2T2NLU4_CORCC|nr:hypothetical protein BS50DRAFT_414280 [Corynespora cassiicola Philippines]